MAGILSNRIVRLWLLLVLLTVTSLELFGRPEHPYWRGAAISAVILIAAAKVRIIGLDFMNLRSAPWPLRLTFEAWLAVISLSLIALYLMSPKL